MVLAEAARPAGAGRHIHVASGNFLRARFLRLLAQKIDQVARREARRAALADIGDRATGKKIRLCRRGEDFGLVAKPLQGSLEETLGASVRAAEQDGDVGALVSGERLRLVSSEVLCGWPHHMF